jgi:hypothetical protein
LKTIEATQSVDSSAWESVKRRHEHLTLKNLQSEAAATEQLVKTRQAGKGFMGTVVICELWKLAIAL